MAQISWTAEAQQWLEDIFEYIAAENPPAATNTVLGIYERAQALAAYSGHAGPAFRLMRGHHSD